MSSDKAQMSNQIQISKEFLDDLISTIFLFDIWILAFGIASIEITICLFSQFLEAIL
jgi:hypothetical protein